MTRKRTAQLLAELKKLADSAVDNLYRRIGLAADVMRDLDWIATVHGGSDLKAMDALTDEYFRDLGGFIALSKLIAMHEEISTDEWSELKYDVAAVEVVYDDRTRTTKEEHGQRTSWKKVAEERGEQVEQLKRQVKDLVDSNTTLREENEDLRRQVARMEGRLEEMDRRHGLIGR